MGRGRLADVLDVEDPYVEDNEELDECDERDEGREGEGHPGDGLAVDNIEDVFGDAEIDDGQGPGTG